MQGFLPIACVCGEKESVRKEIREFLDSMKARHLGISDSVTAALGNVNLYSLFGECTRVAAPRTKIRRCQRVELRTDTDNQINGQHKEVRCPRYNPWPNFQILHWHSLLHFLPDLHVVRFLQQQRPDDERDRRDSDRVIQTPRRYSRSARRPRDR